MGQSKVIRPPQDASTAQPARDDAVALVEGTLAHSRAAVAHRVVALPAHLEEQGVRRGDRVLLQGSNSAALVVTLVAPIHLDSSIVLVDHQQTLDDTRDAMRGRYRGTDPSESLDLDATTRSPAWRRP